MFPEQSEQEWSKNSPCIEADGLRSKGQDTRDEHRKKKLATLGEGEKEIGERGNWKENKEERSREQRVLCCGLCEAKPTPSLTAY